MGSQSPLPWEEGSYVNGHIVGSVSFITKGFRNLRFYMNNSSLDSITLRNTTTLKPSPEILPPGWCFSRPDTRSHSGRGLRSRHSHTCTWDLSCCGNFKLIKTVSPDNEFNSVSPAVCHFENEENVLFRFKKTNWEKTWAQLDSASIWGGVIKAREERSPGSVPPLPPPPPQYLACHLNIRRM